MFDFLDNDWFIIGLEIFFLIFIAYDLKRYFETKKREYLTNIAITLALFIWTAIPFYNSYVTWEDRSKQELNQKCLQDNNTTVCECLNKEIFKEYSYDSFKNLEDNDIDFIEFKKEITEECLDD